MKIATWNVNSLRVRLAHVLAWLQQHGPDLLCLQETKIIDAEFPAEEFRKIGYETAYAGQKTYNGVANISRLGAQEIQIGLPNMEDPQRRVLAATYGDTRIINVYVPNGSAVGSEKYIYKLAWLKQLAGYLQTQLKDYKKLIVLGDFNIAPEDRDVHDPAAWLGEVLVSEEERRAFRELIALGLTDLFRNFPQEEKCFSWWDYRMGAFRRNMGLRIDHILCSQALIKPCTACYIDKEPRRLERPADHTPVIAEFCS